ncbi:26S proteasome non-ATPase regulatory subunit 2-like isoform X2 [Cylas formicarius]|uniref:26S proteasome non-ATPase regulatory subunit 2-like isoform X2 n=1 Tax=Cylas formicarius TaxID=197179 RepID=UPI002958583F|nr:26S proteasome non-ATPase regulatory subunit 2-like isoform X2 [Cylas formicarius]
MVSTNVRSSFKDEGNDNKLIAPSLEMLKFLIRTSTASMTSVPKPLKYLAPHYDLLKETHNQMTNDNAKRALADVISVLALGTLGTNETENHRDCLKYCLMGTMQNIGDWGHEYISQLETEIVQQWTLSHCSVSDKMLMPLIHDIVRFNCDLRAEIQACDLLMEIDKLAMLSNYVASNNYQKICSYLSSCMKYVDNIERKKIMQITYEQYMKFEEYSRALAIALQTENLEWVKDVFTQCKDKVIRYQLAFICARHLYPFQANTDMEGCDELNNILNNNLLSSCYHKLAQELDITEPKSPEAVYKTWLEPVTPRLQILGESLDSAKQNLASSFVNGFVNVGFGTDVLLSTDSGNKWIYRNKEQGMLSATASLGLVHLWDVDGGLTPIDKYLYTSEDYIKAGALLALGIVNCKVRNECDPALALLGDYVNNANKTLQIGSILGLGLAYAGSQREDVIQQLLPILNLTRSIEILALISVSCGLISLGGHNNDVPSAILNRMIELIDVDPEIFKSPHMKLMGFGLAICYFGKRDLIEVPNNAIEVFMEPFKSTMQTMLIMCSYAGTGDVLIVQKLLRMIGEKVPSTDPPPKEKNKRKSKKEVWDYTMNQAMATLAVAAVSFGEEIGMEMVQRIFGHMGRYGEPSVRKAAPLAIALSSISNPQLSVFDVLTKYSHDSDDDVACNAIFGLGLIGAGTNNARLASNLRQLAVYHVKNPNQLFMVRLAQGLVHMGKGTVSLNPLHTDRMLLDRVGMTGLLIVLISLLEPQSLILGKSHYLLYCLVPSIEPRWLLTLDANLEILPTTVRVGQALDVVGTAGTPKTIAGVRTHSTPVLLSTTEKAELANDQYVFFTPTLNGICVLKENPAAQL